MSETTIAITQNVVSVDVQENTVAVDITPSVVSVSAGTSGPQGATGASYVGGDPIYVVVRNATGATMPKGTIVYTSGANGTHTQVSPALANSDATSARV